MTADYDKLCANIKRWRSRAKRAINMLDKLERQKERMERRAAQAPRSLPTETAPAPTPPTAEVVKPVTDEIGIPTFLRRAPLDPKSAELAQEVAETKRQKARGRIEKMKAQQRGETKRMPLTGKAALEAIRQV